MEEEASTGGWRGVWGESFYEKLTISIQSRNVISELSIMLFSIMILVRTTSQYTTKFSMAGCFFFGGLVMGGMETARSRYERKFSKKKKKDLKPSIQQADCVERKWKGVEEKRYKRLGISVFHSQRGEEGFEVDDELWGESRLDGFLKSIERCKTDRWFFSNE